MEIVVMVAVAENGVIGKDGAMPWHLRSDLKRFKALTTGRPLVMGRRTFESLGRPLPGRTNIVITRNSAFRAAGAVVTQSMKEAKAIALGDALRRNVSEIMVIGGAEIYASWIDQADRCEVTHVHAAPAGDAFFTLEKASWEETSRSDQEPGEGDSVAFSFVSYRRRL